MKSIENDLHNIQIVEDKDIFSTYHNQISLLDEDSGKNIFSDIVFYENNKIDQEINLKNNHLIEIEKLNIIETKYIVTQFNLYILSLSNPSKIELIYNILCKILKFNYYYDKFMVNFIYSLMNKYLHEINFNNFLKLIHKIINIKQFFTLIDQSYEHNSKLILLSTTFDAKLFVSNIRGTYFVIILNEDDDFNSLKLIDYDKYDNFNIKKIEWKNNSFACNKFVFKSLKDLISINSHNKSIYHNFINIEQNPVNVRTEYNIIPQYEILSSYVTETKIEKNKLLASSTIHKLCKWFNIYEKFLKKFFNINLEEFTTERISNMQIIAEDLFNDKNSKDFNLTLIDRIKSENDMQYNYFNQDDTFKNYFTDNLYKLSYDNFYLKYLRLYVDLECSKISLKYFSYMNIFKNKLNSYIQPTVQCINNLINSNKEKLLQLIPNNTSKGILTFDFEDSNLILYVIKNINNVLTYKSQIKIKLINLPSNKINSIYHEIINNNTNYDPQINYILDKYNIVNNETTYKNSMIFCLPSGIDDLDTIIQTIGIELILL